MNKLTEGEADAPKQHEETSRRRTRLPPLPAKPLAGVWSPTMTEQQEKEYEQYVKDNGLPF
jgi:hypothetical protein